MLNKTQTEIKKQFRESTTDWLNCPLGVYSILASAVVSRFDTALWGFRKPVRTIEKEREPPDTLFDDPKLDPDDKSEPESADERRYQYTRQRYFKMHDLARHIIHETEILNVAARTLTAILGTQNEVCEGKKDMLLCAQSHRSVEVAEQQIQNLSLRAGAFEKRLENEIKLAFNLSAAEDNKTSKGILEENRSDSKELTKLVSSLTMIFLPASFVSGFFGMNFLDYEGATIQVSTSLWMFFATAIPLTILAVALWQIFSRRHREQQAAQRDIESYEKGKIRRRTSTAIR
ncbi:hypothetical protein OQA88_13369 [Cercophora sp. LCS_1]